ncbi:MAG: glycosyltransferase family 39 protein [Anaerolineae bacterium]|nr:glycosyltransferase family 39 protein [Anaerolineae bacterium]
MISQSGQPVMFRWLAFMCVVIASGVVLIVLPPVWSLLALAILAAGAALIAAWMLAKTHLIGWGGQLRPRHILHGLLALRQQRDTFAVLLALLAVVLMALSAHEFQPTMQSMITYRPTKAPEAYYGRAAPWLFAAGTLVMLAALALSRWGEHRAASSKPAPPVSRRAARHDVCDAALALAGILALWALAEANGGILGIKRLHGLSPDRQFFLLVLGIVFVVWGLGGIGWPGRDAWRRIPWREVALVTALTLAGLGLRVWHVGSAVRTLVDEGHFAFGITYFWKFQDTRLLEPMHTSASFPFLFSYLGAKAVDVFGRNLVGLRLASAVIGALTIPAVYVLGRALYDRVTGLLAAVLLISFPPHVHYSRLALNNIADPLFGALGLGLIARGVRSRRRFDYAAGGAMLGLTQYFYEGGRLLFPVLAVGWLAVGLVIWRPRPSWRGLLLALAAFLIVAAPVYYTLQGLNFPFVNRLDNTRLDDDYWARDREPDTFDTRLRHLRHALLMVVNHPENTFVYYYLYYGGKHPLVITYFVPLFMLGMAVALWHWRAPGFLPVPWLLATALGNMMLVESAVSARYVVVFPALVVLIAAGMRYTLTLLWPPRWPVSVRRELLVFASAGIMAWQGLYYFGPFMDRFNEQVRQHVEADTDDALLRAVDLPPGTEIYIVGDKVLPEGDSRNFLNFLADDLVLHVVKPELVTHEFLAQLPRDVDYAFFVNDGPTLSRLYDIFGIETLVASPYEAELPPGKMLYLYFVPLVAVG